METKASAPPVADATQDTMDVVNTRRKQHICPVFGTYTLLSRSVPFLLLALVNQLNTEAAGTAEPGLAHHGADYGI